LTHLKFRFVPARIVGSRENFRCRFFSLSAGITWTQSYEKRSKTEEIETLYLNALK